MDTPTNVDTSGPQLDTRQLLPWEVLLDAQRDRSERRAWWCAGIASLVAVIAVIGIAALAPYRRNIPYLLMLDRNSGDILSIGAVDQRTIKGYQHLLDEHWVRRYVVARESYFYRLLQEDYDTVMEMSDDDVSRDFSRLYEGSNARDKRLGDKVEITTTVRSVQLSHNGIGDQATVHFQNVAHHLDTNLTDPPEYFIVTTAFHYLPKMFGKELDLVRNPLGFKISAYRPASELPPRDAAAEHAGAAQPGA